MQYKGSRTCIQVFTVTLGSGSGLYTARSYVLGETCDMYNNRNVTHDQVNDLHIAGSLSRPHVLYYVKFISEFAHHSHRCIHVLSLAAWRMTTVPDDNTILVWGCVQNTRFSCDDWIWSSRLIENYSEKESLWIFLRVFSSWKVYREKHRDQFHSHVLWKWYKMIAWLPFIVLFHWYQYTQLEQWTTLFCAKTDTSTTAHLSIYMLPPVYVCVLIYFNYHVFSQVLRYLVCVYKKCLAS